MPGRLVGEVEVVAEVRRKADRTREERQRETRDDLVRAQGDDEKGMDQRHDSTGEGGNEDRDRERPGALHAPEAHHGADEHHPLDSEVQHAGALREQLAERRVEKRRP